MAELTAAQIEWAEKIEQFNSRGRALIDRELVPIVEKLRLAASSFAPRFTQFRSGRPYEPTFENRWALMNYLNSNRRKKLS